MMLKYIYLAVLLLLADVCAANMASPFLVGSLQSAPFSSKDVDILGEKIKITLNENFSEAKYDIEYTIKTNLDGKQIPLLFYAGKHNEDFVVLVDGVQTPLLEIPSKYRVTMGTPFDRFDSSFQRGSFDDQQVSITWGERITYIYKLSELTYFETNLTKGEHTITVRYSAKASTMRSNWVDTYIYGYSLSPAKYWRSFGTLEVTVTAPPSMGAYETNLGNPIRKDSNSAQWKFDKLPADYINISQTPEISTFASAMITIGPGGFTLLFMMLFIWAHYRTVVGYRETNPEGRSWVVILGSIALPLIIMIFYMMTYPMIDAVIGPAASHYHGYTFLVIFLYPIAMPIYWLAMWFIDRNVKQRLALEKSIDSMSNDISAYR